MHKKKKNLRLNDSFLNQKICRYIKFYIPSNVASSCILFSFDGSPLCTRHDLESKADTARLLLHCSALMAERQVFSNLLFSKYFPFPLLYVLQFTDIFLSKSTINSFLSEGFFLYTAMLFLCVPLKIVES